MRYLQFALVFLLLSACDPGIQTVPEPDDLIQREEMIDLMTEMSKLEALVEYRNPGVNRFHPTMLKSADSLFKAHGVNSGQYDRSMEYYGARQEEMQTMYDEVLERLGKELGEIQTEK